MYIYRNLPQWPQAESPAAVISDVRKPVTYITRPRVNKFVTVVPDLTCTFCIDNALYVTSICNLYM